MTPTRPSVGATRHVVSAGHYLAASAAHDVLEGGGNAIDAGCAAGIALGVVQSDLVNIGGVAPIMIRTADTPTPVTIDGLGTWPAALPERHFLDRRGGSLPLGVERVVVPAAIDAWLTALERFGTLRFADVAAAAVRYARDGIPAHPLLVDTITEQLEGYSRWDSTAAIYLPEGHIPKVGQRFVQADLARTLQFLCDQEAAAGGDRLAGLAAVRAAFYAGDVAREIVRFVEGEGGFLAMADMAGFRSQVEPALSVAWRDTTVFTCGPWCQGPVLALALNQIEVAGLEGLDHNDANYIHMLTEIFNNAFADREYHFADPRFVEVPLQRLLSEAHARARVRQIDPQRARGRDMPAAILPLGGRATTVPLSAGSPQAEPDTSYVAVVDAAGNAFSATPSARQTSAFDAEPGHAGSRPRCHALRLSRRRCSDPGHAAGPAQPAPFRDGPAGGDRCAAFRHLQLPLLLCALHPPSGTGEAGGPDRPDCGRGAGDQGAPHCLLARLRLAGRGRLRCGNRPQRRADPRCRRSAAAVLRDRRLTSRVRGGTAA